MSVGLQLDIKGPGIALAILGMVLAYVVGFAPNLEPWMRYLLMIAIFGAIAALLVVEWIHRPNHILSNRTVSAGQTESLASQKKIAHEAGPRLIAFTDAVVAFVTNFCLVIAGAIFGFALGEGVTSPTFKGDLYVGFAIMVIAFGLYLFRSLALGKS